MIYHYCRVSSKDQKLDRQIQALQEYKPADHLFADKMSGKNFDRDEYQAMKAILKPGDEVIVKELDRLGRNSLAVKDEVRWMMDHQITLRILDIPTTLMDFGEQGWVQTVVTNILIEVMSAMAEQERNKIRSRQAEGIRAMPVNEQGKKVSKKTGRTYGRQASIPADFEDYSTQIASGKITVTEACKQMHISRQTYYNIKNEKTLAA